MILWLLFLFSVCFSFGVGSLPRMFVLVMISISSCLYVYSVAASSWYLLLYVLVYVGDVSILFIYLSISIPNVGSAVVAFGYSMLLIGCLYLFTSGGKWILSW